MFNFCFLIYFFFVFIIKFVFFLKKRQKSLENKILQREQSIDKRDIALQGKEEILDQKNEQLLLDSANAWDTKNKTIWSSIWAIIMLSMTALIAGIFIAAFLIPEGIWQLVTILGICIVFLIPCFYALKLEVSVGAYKCKNCGHEIVPTYKEVLMAKHRGFTRHLMCPKCNKRTWCKKIIKK